MLNFQAKGKIQFLQYQAASLLVYRSLLQTEVGQAWMAILAALLDSGGKAIAPVEAYAQWFVELTRSNQGWQDYLISQIFQADNAFSRQAQVQELADLPPHLVKAARHDLQVLQHIYVCSAADLSNWVKSLAPISIDLVSWDQETNPKNPLFLSKRRQQQQELRRKLQTTTNWADWLPDLAAYYYQFGSGSLANYDAWRWQAGNLVGVSYPDPIKLTDLVGYELPKQKLIKNTEALLQGYPALHTILYGSRGSGKSSLVKALLGEYSDRGLRLVEVAKSDLGQLPEITEKLRLLPQKFIIFVDDLSFEDHEDNYKSLKVVLEGNLSARANNVVVYATSNRRHLIREFFADRPRPQDSDEIQAWDTVQEKLSFSDRFGLTLTFEPANQDTYLTIVHHLAQQAGINITPADLDYQALQWAVQHNGRSGRTARQFIDFLKFT